MTAPDPLYVAFIAEFIARNGGCLNAHREACRIRDIFEPEHVQHAYWQDVVDEIVRQARELVELADLDRYEPLAD